MKVLTGSKVQTFTVTGASGNFTRKSNLFFNYRYIGKYTVIGTIPSVDF